MELITAKRLLPLSLLSLHVEQRMEQERAQRQRLSMRESLAQSASGIIAEFKRKSPSKGWIREEGRADVIPASYAAHGASAVSILWSAPMPCCSSQQP